MKGWISLLLSLLIAPISQAKDTPDWVVNYGKSQTYPADAYLVGYGSANDKDAEAYQIAQDNARADLSRSIVVNVKSLLATVAEESNQKFSQYLSSITQSSTSLQLMGLQTEEYIDEKHKMTHALAYTSRSELNRIYANRKANLRREIRSIIAAAQSDEQNSKIAEAVAKYLSLYPLYEELKETETILLVANQFSSFEAAFDELNRKTETSSGQELILSQTEVSNKIDQLLSQSTKSVEDVARAVAYQLSKQVSNPKGQVLITPLTYQDTKMSSSFARYFRSALEAQLGQMAKWNAVSQAASVQPKSAQIMRDLAKASGAEWLLSGTYWEQGEKIKLLVTLRQVSSGKILASADVAFEADVLKAANLNSKPENFQQALIEQKAFAEDEIISGQLQVEVWTNKGNENLLYTEAETMKVYVRVNREAHLRLLYILADGRRTVLYDDLYIDQSKVNHAVEVPAEFECSEPFGAEMLMVVARTGKFEKLETVEREGYVFLKAATAKEAAIATRGFKRKQEMGDAQQTEAKVVITTMKK